MHHIGWHSVWPPPKIILRGFIDIVVNFWITIGPRVGSLNHLHFNPGAHSQCPFILDIPLQCSPCCLYLSHQPPKTVQKVTMSMHSLYHKTIWAIYQLYHYESKYFDIYDFTTFISSYKTNTLSLLFKVLAHWNNSPGRRVAAFGHINAIPNQPVFLLTPYCRLLNG